MPVDFNHLHNSYFILRHGRSTSNDEGVISSDPTTGLSQHGLTIEGRDQVHSSITEARMHSKLSKTTILLSSDFLRAKESAEIARDILGITFIELSPLLRERSFGSLDGMSNSKYEEVWNADKADNLSSIHPEIESVLEVKERVVNLISDLEMRFTGKTILLVSHGDTLQILQTAFANIEPKTHRSLPPLQNGELRKLF